MPADEARTPRAVLVTGYGNSGVTAVMDLLAECDGFLCPKQEFFLVQHPDGILALEDALVHSWSEFAPDWALRRFRELVEVLARRPTRFRFGLDYGGHFCPDFRTLALAYADALAGIKYEGHLMFRRAEMGRAEHFAYMFFRRFDIARGNQWFARRYDTSFVPDPDAFLGLTRDFLGRLLRASARGGETDVALCLGASPYQVERSARVFPRATTILVDRDPRDIFLSAQSASYMPRDVDRFVAWYRSTRENAKKGPEGASLEVMFEDLVTSYDETVKKVFAFLGVEAARHARKRTILSPEASAKRIAKWKAHPQKDDIRRIERELGAYLWEARA